MALETTHDCYCGPCTEFHLWRAKLAELAGMPPLDNMEGFGGNTKWESLSPDVLHILLNHSDIDGDIEHQFCKPLADRLAELLMLYNEDDDSDIKMKLFRYRTQRFIEGLSLADSLGENVEFY
jgi:hypothetical protein